MTLFCEKHLVKSMDKLSLVLRVWQLVVFPDSSPLMNSLYSQKFNLKTCWVHLLNVLLKLQPAHLHSLCLSLEPHRVPRLLQQTPNRSPCCRITLLRTPSCLSVTHRTKSQPCGLAHGAAPHLASACFQGLTALSGVSCWNGREFARQPHGAVSCPTKELVLRLPFCLSHSSYFFFSSYSSIMIQLRRHFLVSLSFSGLLYISVLTSLDWNALVNTSVSPLDYKLFKGRCCLMHFLPLVPGRLLGT